jgi:Fe2+ or Zn2+ uptake regulation protein
MLTKQKKSILSVLRKAGRPLTREEILCLGRKELPRLGSATVDRFIKQMCENFELVGLSFPGQPTRFELPADKEHPHFICRVCKKVFDLDIPMRLPKVTLPEGFHLSGGEVVFSGTCPKCEGRVIK